MSWCSREKASENIWSSLKEGEDGPRQGTVKAVDTMQYIKPGPS